jgi:septal ring-binding cell division protein DamX
MELIIGLIVLAVVAYLVFKPKKAVEAEVAPYKVDAAPEAQPEVASVAEQASQAVVESIAPAKPARKPRAKKPAAKKPAAKKTAAKKPAKKVVKSK